MKICYKCGHHTEKFIEIPVVVKKLLRDKYDDLYFDSWNLELRPYCCFCTKIKEPEDELENIDIEEYREEERF